MGRSWVYARLQTHADGWTRHADHSRPLDAYRPHHRRADAQMSALVRADVRAINTA